MAVVARVSLVKLAFALASELSDSSSEVHGSEFSISSHEEPKIKKLKDCQKTTGTGDVTCHVLVWPWSAAFAADFIVEYPKQVM